MPEMIQFTVTQTRQVKVIANSAADACRIGAAAFANGQTAFNSVIDGPEGVWGNTDSKIKEIHLDVIRDSQ